MFKTNAELDEYLSGKFVKCLICSKGFLLLALHIPRAHGMTVKEYKEAHGIPYTRALVPSHRLEYHKDCAKYIKEHPKYEIWKEENKLRSKEKLGKFIAQSKTRRRTPCEIDLATLRLKKFEIPREEFTDVLSRLAISEVNVENFVKDELFSVRTFNRLVIKYNLRETVNDILRNNGLFVREFKGRKKKLTNN